MCCLFIIKRTQTYPAEKKTRMKQAIGNAAISIIYKLISVLNVWKIWNGKWTKSDRRSEIPYYRVAALLWKRHILSPLCCELYWPCIVRINILLIGCCIRFLSTMIKLIVMLPAGYNNNTPFTASPPLLLDERTVQ